MEFESKIKIINFNYMYVTFSKCTICYHFFPSPFSSRRLRHPNVVLMLGCVVTDTDILIVTKYIKGCNLAVALGLVDVRKKQVRKLVGANKQFFYSNTLKIKNIRVVHMSHCEH